MRGWCIAQESVEKIERLHYRRIQNTDDSQMMEVKREKAVRQHFNQNPNFNGSSILVESSLRIIPHECASMICQPHLGDQNNGKCLVITVYFWEDAKCGTVVPQQVNLFVRREVWGHTDVGYTRMLRHSSVGLLAKS